MRGKEMRDGGKITNCKRGKKVLGRKSYASFEGNN